MSDTNRPPLWEAMDNGMDAQANKEVGQTDPLIWRRIRAAEIRAIADWILAELAADPEDEGWGPPNLIELPDLEALLTEQAEIAERGDE